jgi:hypothetical protein
MLKKCAISWIAKDLDEPVGGLESCVSIKPLMMNCSKTAIAIEHFCNNEELMALTHDARSVQGAGVAERDGVGEYELAERGDKRARA